MYRIQLPEGKPDTLFETELLPVTQEDVYAAIKAYRGIATKNADFGSDNRHISVNRDDRVSHRGLADALKPGKGDSIKRYPSQGEIKAFGGRANKVAVGKPVYYRLDEELLKQNPELNPGTRELLKHHDFHIVSLSCSFLPDNKCRFLWTKFGVDLMAFCPETGACIDEEPIAYDMMPEEVNAEIKVKRETNLGPKLKFKFGPVEGEAGLGGSDTKEYIRYEPEIFGFGIGTPKPCWNFRKSKEKDIQGNKRDLNLIVQAPKNSVLEGRFLIAAEVEAFLDRWIPIPLSSKRDDKVVDKTYKLSR